jgi:hypothetical protein
MTESALIFGSVLNRIRTDMCELIRDISLSVRDCFTSRADIVWLITVTLIGACCRGYFLDQPMRYDESYTFLNFANQDLTSLFNYPLPNNHVLHTLLIRLSTLMFGYYPQSIRFTAFLSGIAIIPLTFCFCRKLIPETSGFFASALVSVFPYMVLYSVMARGYSLIVALTLALALIGFCVTERLSLTGCALLSLISALGMLTMPSMLYAIVGVNLWLVYLLVKKQHFKTVLGGFVIPCAAMTFIFTVMLYIPSIIVSGVCPIVANRFVKSLPWEDFFSEIYPHFSMMVSDFSRDVPVPIIFVCAILLAAGVSGAVKKRNWAILLLLPSVLLGSGVVFLLKHSIPFVRTWMYIIPFFFIITDMGLAYITESIARKYRMLIPSVLLIFGVFGAGSLISGNVIAKYPDTGHFPEAPMMVMKLKPLMNPGDSLHVGIPADWPVFFYMWYYGVPQQTASVNHEHVTEFFILQKNLGTMPREPLLMLFDYKNAALYRKLYVGESERGKR